MGEELTIRGFQLLHKDDVALVPLSHVHKLFPHKKKTSRRARNFNVDQEKR